MALLARRWLECRAFRKDLVPAGVVKAASSDAESVSFTAVYNGTGTGSVTLPIDHKLTPVLMQPGMRLQYRYREEGNPNPIEQMSGPVVASVGGWSLRGAVMTFTSVSDEALLGCLAWPNPTQAITNQTSEYDARSGQVDAIVHDIVRDNLVTRLGLPVRMVPDAFTGPAGSISARMQPLIDVVKPLLESTGRGIRFWQWNPGDAVPFYLTGSLVDPCVLVQVYTVVDRSYVQWTPQAGITGGTATTSSPTTTRVVVGGQGEAAARTWYAKTDTLREADWGPLGVRESLVDARDAADAAALERRAVDTLAAGAARAALALSLIHI